MGCTGAKKRSLELEKCIQEETVLSHAQFLEVVRPELSKKGKSYKRTSFDYARKAEINEKIVHAFDDQVFSEFVVNDAKTWLVITDSVMAETFPMADHEFKQKYAVDDSLDTTQAHFQKKGFKRYRFKSDITAMKMEDIAIPGFGAGLCFKNTSGVNQTIAKDDFVWAPLPNIDSIDTMRGLALRIHWQLMDHSPSQQEMMAKFLPLLKKEGRVYAHGGFDYARPGQPQEVIKNIIGGKLRGEMTVPDGTFWVIKSSDSSGALAVVTAKEFRESYDNQGADVDPEATNSPSLNHLRTQGFKRYTCKKKRLARVLLDTELETYFPACKWTDAMGVERAVEKGDYIVTPFPNSHEVFIKSALAFDEKYSVVKDDSYISQAELIKHFTPVLEKRGRQYTKCISDFARRAKKDEEVVTVVKGVETFRHHVADDTSWVICTNTDDRQQYVVKQSSFEDSYIIDNPKILAPELTRTDSLKKDGFKLYRSNKTVTACRLEDEDILHRLPTGKYWVGGEDGAGYRASAGDYIVCFKRETKTSMYTMDPETFNEKYMPTEHFLKVNRGDDSRQSSKVIDPVEGLDAMVSFNAASANEDAIEVTGHLNQQGVKTFCTAVYCPAHPGSDWQTSTNEGILHARTLILLVTKGWLTSAECQDETRVFCRLKKDRTDTKDRHIIPVIYDDISSFDRQDPTKALFNLNTTQNLSRASASWKDDILQACQEFQACEKT